MNSEPTPMPTLFAHPDDYVTHDAECLKELQEMGDAMKEYNSIEITDMRAPFDFGFDHENGDKDRRNRLEETVTKLEKVLAEEIVVPGCTLAECKRSKDGVRIKVYWAGYGEDSRVQNHILLHVCKYTFKEVNVPQIMVLCKKRGGDIFPYIDIVKQIKQKIENK